MNLDELTLGQIKELRLMFGSDCKKDPEHPFLGKKVIVRTYSAGVHYGVLDYKNKQEVRLKNSIRIWKWAGACSLSQLAVDGTKNPDECKFSVVTNDISLEQMIELIPCSDKAIKSIESVKSWQV